MNVLTKPSRPHLDENLPANGFPKAVEVRESYRSRKNQLLALVAKHCPACVELGDESRVHPYRVKFGRRSTFFRPKHYLTVMSHDHTDLFLNGRVVDIDIHVFNQDLLGGAIAIASDYTALTGKKAEVVKEF